MVGEDIKEFQGSHRWRAKISSLFFEKCLVLCFFFFFFILLIHWSYCGKNRDDKCLGIDSNYWLSFKYHSIYINLSKSCFEEHFHRNFYCLNWGEFHVLPYKLAGQIFKAILTIYALYNNSCVVLNEIFKKWMTVVSLVEPNCITRTMWEPRLISTSEQRW